MKEEPIVVLLSIIVIFTAVASLGIGFVWSLPYAIRRMRRYRVPGSARRLFAQFTLSNIVLPLLCMIAFLAVGGVTFLMDPADKRIEIVRFLILFSIVATAIQIILAPIGHKYVEDAAERERQDAQDTDIREIASETLAGVRAVQEAVRDVQEAAELVRTKLKEHDESRVALDESRDAKQGEGLRLSQDIVNEQDRLREVQDTAIREIATETLTGVREVQESAELVRTKLQEHDESRVALDKSRDAKQGEDLRLSEAIVKEQERIRNEDEK